MEEISWSDYPNFIVEPVDTEYYPGQTSTDNVNNTGVVDSDLRQFHTPLPLPKQIQFGSENEMEILKKKLSNAQLLISKQSCQLQNANRTISGLQENILHQEELLTKTEADYATEKAIGYSENAVLRKLLERERTQRIHSEQKLKMFQTSRNQAVGQRVTSLAVGTTARSIGGGDVSRFSNRKQGHGFNYCGNRNGREIGSNSVHNEEEVAVVNMVDNTTNRFGTRPMIRHTPGTSQVGNATKKQVLAKSASSTLAKNCNVFLCTGCGQTFNADWKLISHGKCHGNQNTLGKKKMEGDTFAMRLEGKKSGSCKIINQAKPTTSRAATQQQSALFRPQSSTCNRRHGNKFKCATCNQLFPMLSSLKKHKKKAHDIEESEFSIGCSDCGKVFADRKQHVKHRKSVHGTTYYRSKKKDTLQENNQPSTSSSTTTTDASICT